MTEKEQAPQLKIVKPSFMEKFKSKRPSGIDGVETLLSPLKIMRIAEANDWTRLHPLEDDYWTWELCFVSVPVKGEKRDMLHLIDEDLAAEHLPANKIKRQRLALASKPFDNLFFCIVPSRNLDNSWNQSAAAACEKGKTVWIQAASRAAEGVENYQIKLAHDPDAFPDPKWPSRSLEDLLEITFRNANIDTLDHPAMRRLLGMRQDLG